MTKFNKHYIIFVRIVKIKLLMILIVYVIILKLESIVDYSNIKNIFLFGYIVNDLKTINNNYIYIIY